MFEKIDEYYKLKRKYESTLSDKKNNILKTLLLPSDMGENFKMMILCDDDDGNFVESHTLLLLLLLRCLMTGRHLLARPT